MKKFVTSSFFVLLLSLAPIHGALADTTPPGDVEGMELEALDGAVKLTWLPPTDGVEVEGYEIHYGLTPVTMQGQAGLKFL